MKGKIILRWKGHWHILLDSYCYYSSLKVLKSHNSAGYVKGTDVFVARLLDKNPVTFGHTNTKYVLSR